MPHSSEDITNIYIKDILCSYDTEYILKLKIAKASYLKYITGLYILNNDWSHLKAWNKQIWTIDISFIIFILTRTD